MRLPTLHDAKDKDKKARPGWAPILEDLFSTRLVLEQGGVPSWSPVARILLPYFNQLVVEKLAARELRGERGNRIERKYEPWLWNANVESGEGRSAGQFKKANDSKLSRRESGAEALQPLDFVEYAWWLKQHGSKRNDLVSEVAETAHALCGGQQCDGELLLLGMLLAAARAAGRAVDALWKDLSVSSADAMAAALASKNLSKAIVRAIQQAVPGEGHELAEDWRVCIADVKTHAWMIDRRNCQDWGEFASHKVGLPHELVRGEREPAKVLLVTPIDGARMLQSLLPTWTIALAVMERTDGKWRS